MKLLIYIILIAVIVVSLMTGSYFGAGLVVVATVGLVLEDRKSKGAESSVSIIKKILLVIWILGIISTLFFGTVSWLSRVDQPPEAVESDSTDENQDNNGMERTSSP